MSLLTQIRQKSYQLGFDLCGVTSDFEPKEKTYFLKWLQDKRFAEMHWLNKNTSKRLKPQTIMDETKSVLVLACSYAHSPKQSEYKLARYAHGQDYHIWMKKKLELLGEAIQKNLVPGFMWRSFVDTGPVLERDLATKAGLGWIGKNTNLLNEELGSYLFLGVLFCNLELPNDAPSFDQCSTCTLCLEACPTQALDPYQLDPGKCLAYHNIEKRGGRDQSYWKKIDDNLVGCDICQDVCPWNAEVNQTRQSEWLQSFDEASLGSFSEILKMSATQYKNKIRHSAISRIKHEDFMRNVFIVLANTQRTDLIENVKDWQQRYPNLCEPEISWCLESLA